MDFCTICIYLSLLGLQFNTTDFIGSKTDSEGDFFNYNMVGFFLKKIWRIKRGTDLENEKKYNIVLSGNRVLWGDRRKEVRVEGGRERGSREKGRERGRE